MLIPRILIFGGNSDQLFQVTRLIPGICPVSVFPLEYTLSLNNVTPVPRLVLIIPEPSFEGAKKALLIIRKKLPKVPVLFIADNPDKEDIIDSFGLGVTHFLLFPLQPEKFLAVIERLIYEQHRVSLFSLFRFWAFKLKSILKLNEVKIFKKQPPLVLPTLLGLPDGEQDLIHKNAEQKATPDLNVRFLGKFNILIKGKKIKLFNGEKINALLAFLLYSHRNPVHRETLISKFWGCNNPVAARNSLNVATHNIRRHLQEKLPGTTIIQYCNDNYSIDPTLDIATDTDQFLYYSRQGQSIELKYGLEKAFTDYQKAASFYKGDFLEDIYYEEWCDAERDILKETYLLILDRLGAYFFNKEVYTIAVNIFKKMLDKDTCLENVHRKLILCYYKLGLRDRAIKQYYKCAKSLKDELNIEPSIPTKELFQLIRIEKNIPAILF